MVSIASIIIAIITLVKVRSFAAYPNVASYKGLNGLKIANIVFVPVNSLVFLWSALILLSSVFAASAAGSYGYSYYSYSLSYEERLGITVVFVIGIVETCLSIIALIMSIIALAKSSGLIGRYKSQMAPVSTQPYAYQQPAYSQHQPMYQPASAPPATYCTSCGTPNAAGATYCISCGNALEKR